MRLYKNASSPYARLVTVAAVEWGLIAHIEIVDIDPWKERQKLASVSPAAKVPALVTDEGALIVESGNICDYLAQIAGSGIPKIGNVDYFHRLGLARAAMDCAFGAFLQLRESGGAETHLVARWLQAITGIALALDPCAEARLEAERPDLADLTAAAAYLYVDFRLAEIPWRMTAPGLGVLVDRLAARPSFRAG
jgi:glutathione S-transferase